MGKMDELIRKAEEKEFFTPGDIAPVLGCDPHSIRLQARQGSGLGFPVVCIGSRVKIPARKFLKFMGIGE